jgi:FkbM family methyltransferase
MALIISHKISPRREGGSQRSAYGVLLFGALCMSTWVLLSHQLSVALPLAHAPFGASLPWASSSSSSSLGKPVSTLQQLMADLRPHASTAAAAAGGERLARGTSGSSGRRTLLVTFQRSKTAMSFLMVTCRMCSNAVAADLDAWRLHAPVTSTLLESIISNTPLEERVSVDVGAGLGYFAMLAAAWGSKVVAFEPDAWARDVLTQNAALIKDGRVKVVPYAAGAVTLLPDKQQQQQPTVAAAAASSSTTASNITATNSTESSRQVAVVKLSEAISADVAISTLIVDGSCQPQPQQQQRQQQQGAAAEALLPDFEGVMEGAYDMLGRVQVGGGSGRVWLGRTRPEGCSIESPTDAAATAALPPLSMQWLFIPSLCEASSPRVKRVLRDILVRGNFSHVYAYDEDAEPVADDDAVEQRQAAMLAQPEQHQQEAAGISVAAGRAPSLQGGAAVKAPSSTLAYPADAHLQDVTQPVRDGRADAVFAANFVFARAPLGGTLTIQMPKPLVWDNSQMMADMNQLQQQLAGDAGGGSASSMAAPLGGEPAQAPSPNDPPEVAVRT